MNYSNIQLAFSQSLTVITVSISGVRLFFKAMLCNFNKKCYVKIVLTAAVIVL